MEHLITDWIFSSLRKASEFPSLMWEIIWVEINLCITWFVLQIKSKFGYLWWTFHSKIENRCHFYGKNRNSVLHIALGFKQHKWTEQKHKQDRRIHGTALWKHFLLQSRYLYLKYESARENLDTVRFPETAFSSTSAISTNCYVTSAHSISVPTVEPGIHLAFPLTLLPPPIMYNI